MPETKQMLFHFPPAVRDAIKTYASMRDLTMNAAVRQLIAAGLEKEANDLWDRGEQMEKGRQAVYDMVQDAKDNHEQMAFLFEKLKEAPELPDPDDLPGWLQEGYTSTIELLTEANRIRDLSLQVQRST